MTKARSGPASFGFRREGTRLVADDTEAPIRRRIFELFAEHQRKKTVAEILSAEGITTRNGSPFTGQTIGRLLQDETVTGVDGRVEALVSQELFDQCQAILTTQRASGGAHRKVVHLFSGLVFCECGQKMYVPSATQKYVCSGCRRKIPIDDLEAVFCSQVANATLTSNTAALLRKLMTTWDAIPFEDKRKIVESVTDRIAVGDKTITCSLVSL